ncbi:MAG: GatB/YqeY domain-containing protein [Desulfobacterales bacterium]
MTLQKRIKSDLARAMKAKDDVRKEAIRVILGEFGRLEQKDLSDSQVIAVLKKLIKSERELLQKQGITEDSDFVAVAESYMPEPASKEEIQTWIDENVDFSQFSNTMQAMGIIMNHFGPRADGNAVKEILKGTHKKQ